MYNHVWDIYSSRFTILNYLVFGVIYWIFHKIYIYKHDKFISPIFFPSVSSLISTYIYILFNTQKFMVLYCLVSHPGVYILYIDP